MPVFSQLLSFPQSAPVSATVYFFTLCWLSSFLSLSLLPPLLTPTSSLFFSFYLCLPISCLPPCASHLASFLTLSGISLWRWIWSQCVSTATNACQTTWGAVWPSASVTQKRRRRSRWYPCVCDALFLSARFHYCLFGQFPSPLLPVSFPFPDSFILFFFFTVQVNTKHVTSVDIDRWNNEWN